MPVLIRFIIISIVFLLSGQTRSYAEITLVDFVALPQPLSKADLICGNLSRNEWSVSKTNGQIKVNPYSYSATKDHLPFRYKPDIDRRGDRHVMQLTDGWLVGFDGGEFGGGLWWFSPHGERNIRLKPPADAPVNPKDIFLAENIRGFSNVRDNILILMGLDHLSGRSGRIFRLVQKSGQWGLSLFALLDGSPTAWFVDQNRLYVVTGTGLWTVQPNGEIKKFHKLDIGLLYPNSIVSGPEGELYIGMRRYILMLKKTSSSWSETWYVKSGCEKVVIKKFECNCLTQVGDKL